MAAAVVETVLSSPIAKMTTSNNRNSKPLFMRVCFSFAAYAKNLIDYLKYCNVPVEEGLTDAEFSSIESTFDFTFPPDLRSVLQEGLPVGSGFPNWRLFSVQQLQILTRLPIIGLCKEVARHNFWLESWGERPVGDDEAVDLANGFLKTVPVLVPIYRNFYIPSAPCMAGNPVFYVDGSDVKLMSFDISGFFQQVEFGNNDDTTEKTTNISSKTNFSFNAPAWAATEPRRIEFWTALVERGERVAASIGGVHWWWWNRELGGCLEQAFWRLRDGGWNEEEVRDMMMMMDDRDETEEKEEIPDQNMVTDREMLMWHLSLLSSKLLSAGWSSEEVMDIFRFPSES